MIVMLTFIVTQRVCGLLETLFLSSFSCIVGGDGYVEDGREIFDDDLDEQSIEKDKKVGKKRDHSGKPKNVEPPTGNIQKMLANMPTKKKKEVHSF